MTPLLDDGPYLNLHHNLVHAARGGDVALTMIDGRIVVDDGQLVTAHLPTLIAEANRAIRPLLERRDAWIRASGGSKTEIRYT
jgi:5-methylthioadenosine/S-adenosylhomocysteine deaminase